MTPGDRAVQLAVDEAVRAGESAVGVSSPNPPVGAAVLDVDGMLVATGATEPAGGRHAEAVALDAAGPAARGGTLVVTLEPCCHTGRTGPCTDRVLEAGVARVVYGVTDPNPVAAGGADVLRRAGLDVSGDPLLEALAAADALKAWLHRQDTGRPLVTWKYAATLDGYVAAADGTSRWITGPVSRQHAHQRRELVDAILVGTGTVLADDPSLSARYDDGSPRVRSPLACAMGTREVPASAAIRSSPGGFRHLPTRDPAEALDLLPEALHVLVEGGPTVAGAFLSAGLVDRVDAYIAPMVLGGGRPIVEGADVATLAAAHRFSVDYQEHLGADSFLRLTPPHVGEPAFEWRMYPPTDGPGADRH